MTILPRGPVPPTAIFAIAAAGVMLLGLLLEAVSLTSVIVVWLLLAGYVIYSWRSGLWVSRK